MSYDRPTSKDVRHVFGQYEELVKEYGLIRPGYNLSLDIGSKTYGRAYRVYEVADRSLWGPDGWPGNGGIGMDYGCSDSPDTDDEGTGGHEPDVSTVKVPPPPVGTSVVDWAKVYGIHYRWMAALDNYEPTREYAYGDLWTYPLRSDDGLGIVLDGSSQMKDRTKMTAVVDDGETVRPYYVASWNANSVEDYVILHPFPTNYDDDGTPKVRPDNGRVVDMSGWMIGPSRLYHLKVSKAHEE